MKGEYDYSTAEKAISSLELAYDNEDLSQVLISKDFETEAKLILKDANLNISEEIVRETAEALRLSLIKNLQENGYPYFGNVNKSLSEVEKINSSLYKLRETLVNEGGRTSIYDVYLSYDGSLWKVVIIEETNAV